MAILDTKRRLLQLKIVYYGPALCGKTTNLETLHRLIDPAGNTEIASLATEGDRTLFFDLLPIDLGELHGLRMTARLFTVPGQVFYNSTRRLVLQGADAVVFVADSRPDSIADNRESMTNLHRNLMANGTRPGAIPVAIQANKRDIADALPIAGLEGKIGADDLRQHGHIVVTPVVAASARTGEGVIETLGVALAASIPGVHERYGLERLGLTRAAMRAAVDRTLSGCARTLPTATKPPDRPPAVRTREVPPSVSGAAAPMATAADTDAASFLSVLGSLALRVGTGAAATTTTPSIAQAVVDAARATLPGGAASLLLTDPRGVLAVQALAGLRQDPFLVTDNPSLAEVLLNTNRAQSFYDLDTELVFSDTDLLRQLAPQVTAAVVPFVVNDRRGLLCVYGSDPDVRASPATLRLLTIVAAIAAGALGRELTDADALEPLFDECLALLN